MKIVSFSLALALSIASASGSYAQKQASKAASAAAEKPAPVAAEPALDQAINELYGVISGPAGQKRDWDKFRSMYAADAQMGIAFRNKEGVAGYKPLTPEEYIKTSGPFLEEKGFFEKEISRKVERFGQLVHVWSTYEAREKETDAKPFMRGINSIQLVMVAGQYKIASIIWQAESPAQPLPAQYLPAANSVR